MTVDCEKTYQENAVRVCGKGMQMLINDIRGYPSSQPSEREGRLAEGTGFAVHPREGV